MNRPSDKAHDIATWFEMEMKASGHASTFDENGVLLRKLWFPLWIMMEMGLLAPGPSAPHRSQP